jgi:hypothetical protein
MSSEEKSFKFSVSDEQLDLLRQKLATTRLPDELQDAKWDYGVPLADVQRLLAYWRDTFDLRSLEARVNQLPMFTRPILVDGYGTLNIHYVHQRSSRQNAIPLAFIHGCKSIIVILLQRQMILCFF